METLIPYPRPRKRSTSVARVNDNHGPYGDCTCCYWRGLALSAAERMNQDERPVRDNAAPDPHTYAKGEADNYDTLTPMDEREDAPDPDEPTFTCYRCNRLETNCECQQ